MSEIEERVQFGWSADLTLAKYLVILSPSFDRLRTAGLGLSP